MSEDIEMGMSAFSIPLVVVVLALPVYPETQPAMPTMASVEPGSGKVGDVLSIQGANLGSDFIAALYLTDGTTDVKVPILEQTATLVRFRIPPEAKPGRVALMILTKEKVPRLIEEPVKITVESENPTTTASVSARRFNNW